MSTLPMKSPPENELGVVYIFSDWAKHHGYKVESIKPGFPDCIAVKNNGSKEDKVRIEFEFESRNFKRHKHNKKKVDWIVCWEHNWRKAPDDLKIIELSSYYGLGFNVWWHYPGSLAKFDICSNYRVSDVNVDWKARKGDYVIYDIYWNKDEAKVFDEPWASSCVYGVHKIVSEPTDKLKRSHYAKANVQRLCKFDRIDFYNDIIRHPSISEKRIGRYCVTSQWPEILDLLIKKCPEVEKRLKKLRRG